MPQPTGLLPLPVQNVGTKGLNTEAANLGLGPEWASQAENAVFDFAGRLGARKGVSASTTTPISGTPDVEAVFEYELDDTTTFVISAANAKLYYGTTTLTEITGSLSITNNNWKFQNFNGKVVGWQDSEEPIVWTGSSNFATLQSTITAWASTTAYAEGDRVRATSGNTSLYFYCTTAGTSGGTEPTWDTTEGNTTTDSSVSWETCVIPTGNEVLSGAGRLWAVDSDYTTIRYSGLLQETVWDTYGGGGLIDTTKIFGRGGDHVNALAMFNNFLIIFGNYNVLAYANPDVPADAIFAISDRIVGVGTQFRDTVCTAGKDLLFLSDGGVVSLSRAIQGGDTPLVELSQSVRTVLQQFVGGATTGTTKALYSPEEGFYLLKLGTYYYCFDMKHPLPNGSLRATTWSGCPIYSFCRAKDGTIYIGSSAGGYVGKYSGYDDNGATYNFTYQSPWLDFEQIAPQEGMRGLKKILKKLVLTYTGGVSSTIYMTWGFDFAESSYNSRTITSTTAFSSEYGSAEYGIDEWSGGGTSISEINTNLQGSGQYFRFAIIATISSSAFSIQKVDVLIKIGRRTS